MQVLLPLKEPFTKTFPKDANAVSILLNYEQSYPWLMNNFIQLTSWGHQYLDYYDFHYRYCPLIKYQRIMRDIVDRTGMGFSDFIRASIDKGYYAIVPVITNNIASYDFEGVHDMLVYGYEDKKKFYIADNFKNGRYQKSECTALEFQYATEKMLDRRTWGNGFYGTFELLSITKRSWAKLEPERIKKSLEDYLASRPTSMWYVNAEKWDSAEFSNRVFGIACYQTFFQHISLMKESNMQESTLRAFRLQWEHKKIMLDRLGYLKNIFAIDNELCMLFGEIEHLAKIAWMLVIKHMIKEDINIICRLSDIENEIMEKEIVAYRNLLALF